ncbi:MAG: hypothetical protein M9930_20405 [Anaerolineae bacterium]|nr:hypothetical protein [Anaerolineae bacterium]
MTNNIMNVENAVHKELWLLATAVRDRCFSAALTAYKDASIDGLCHDGARECALEAMRAIDLETVVSNVIAEK